MPTPEEALTANLATEKAARAAAFLEVSVDAARGITPERRRERMLELIQSKAALAADFIRRENYPVDFAGWRGRVLEIDETRTEKVVTPILHRDKDVKFTEARSRAAWMIGYSPSEGEYIWLIPETRGFATASYGGNDAEPYLSGDLSDAGDYTYKELRRLLKLLRTFLKDYESSQVPPPAP